tara:strand:+ start:26636 stop:27430 length:795 start_codon:yes stop_codon:yes gene_type:complete
MKKKFNEIILVTGGFDPIHSGHITYFKAAKKISNFLVVGINSDKWLVDKKNYCFMPFNERKKIIENLQMVNKVIDFDDLDGSAIDAINKCKNISEKVIFANGGDRDDKNTPELDKFRDDNSIDFVFGVGGKSKINSSSLITDDFLIKSQKKSHVNKPWGSFITFNKGDGYKIKLLIIKKGEKLSLQFHNRRSEQWIILKGHALIELEKKKYKLVERNHIEIPKKFKHRVENIGDEDLIILEANFGSYIEEDDIVRLEDIYNRVI